MSLARRLGAVAVLLTATARGQSAVTIHIDPSKTLGPTSRYLTAVCLEDVNHEVYGGLYSQMIFGESFQEPAVSTAIRGFTAWGGNWSVADGVLDGSDGDGPKLVRDGPAGDVGVDVFLPGGGGGNAGLIVGVRRPGVGADDFDGYELSLDAAAKTVRVGRHHHDFKLVRDVPCDVASDRWMSLALVRRGRTADVLLDGKSVVQFDAADLPAGGSVGLRQWRRPARYRNLWVSDGTVKTAAPFEPGTSEAVSGMWRAFHRGDAAGSATIDAAAPFVGTQCQRVSLTGGRGSFGVENQGLNRSGIGLVARRPYEGHLWARADVAAKATVALASADGSHVYATADVAVGDAAWHRYDFTLTPDTTDPAGRFEVGLSSPGSVALGYVFLEPGEWGRFKGLPVRRDVLDALVDQGVTAIRYGGSMVNTPGYRWKNMVGERDRRPPYHGTWYPQSTNGWAIPDFLNLCDAAGFLPVPDFSVDESPADMADFVQYANGPADSPWGAKREADGHPAPYGLTHIELGNEERVDGHYYERFAGIARAVWAIDPKMILTVGDFEYRQPIADAMHVVGATSGITDLSAHRTILALARQFDAEVWFDVHVWTDQPPASRPLLALPTYVDAIDELADGAKHRVVVFELNANNHGQRRAVANAQAMIRLERDGRLPFVASANALQVDGQNDNGWDQGLLFVNSGSVWLQPPGYVTRMFARSRLAKRIACNTSGDDRTIDVAATASDDGKEIELRAVNSGTTSVATFAEVGGWSADRMTVVVQTLAADLAAVNTAARPATVRTTGETSAGASFTLRPHSIAVVRLTDGIHAPRPIEGR